MGPIGFQEIVVIMLLALIFLGPKKLPDIASGIGKAIREVRKATADIKNEIELDDAIRKPLEELREATMLPPEELKRRDEERKWRERQDREERERQARDGAGAGNGATDPATAAADTSADEYRNEYGHDDYHDPDAGSSGDPDQHGEHQVDPQAHLPEPVTATSPPPVEVKTDPVLPPVSSTAAAPPPAGAGSDRTVAMTLPPPMEGTHTPTLPPPKPAAARRATPPPLPAAALKPSDSAGVPGTVPRPGSGATLVGMPLANLGAPGAPAGNGRDSPDVPPDADGLPDLSAEAKPAGKARSVRSSSKTPKKV